MNVCLMILIQILTGSFALDQRGRKFILVTPGNSDKVELHISGPAGSDVHLGCSAISINESYFIDNTGLLILDQFRYSNALTLCLMSSADVSVHVVTGERSKEGYIVFPLAALSTKYILASFTLNQGDTTQWLAVAVEDDTYVSVDFNKSHCVYNTFVTNVDKNLSKFENNSGSCTKDISGTFIRSTKPIAVFTRILCAMNSYVYCESQIIMLPPVVHFGKQYVLQVPDIPQFKVSYKMIAASNNTTIIQNNGKTFRLCSGCFTIFEVLNPLYIRSDKPLMVLALSQIQNNISPRSLSILNSVESFMWSYAVHKEDGKSNILVLSTGNDAIGSLVSQYNVTPIRIEGCDFSVVTLNLTEPVTNVTLTSPFGAFIYIIDGWMFGFPVGFHFKTKNEELRSREAAEASTTIKLTSNGRKMMSSAFDYEYIHSTSTLSVSDAIHQTPLSLSNSADILLTDSFKRDTASARKVLRRSHYVNQVLNSLDFSINEFDDNLGSTFMDATNLNYFKTPSHGESSIDSQIKTLSHATSFAQTDMLHETTTEAHSIISTSVSMLNGVRSNYANIRLDKSVTPTPNTISSSTNRVFQVSSWTGTFRLGSGSILFKRMNSNELQSSSSASSIDASNTRASSTSVRAKSDKIRSATASIATGIEICTKICTPISENITDGYLLAIGKKIKERLLVDRKLLTAQVQKKKSTPDKRPSSTGMGIVGIICLMVPVFLAVLTDATNILNKIKHIKRKTIKS